MNSSKISFNPGDLVEIKNSVGLAIILREFTKLDCINEGINQKNILRWGKLYRLYVPNNATITYCWANGLELIKKSR